MALSLDCPLYVCMYVVIEGVREYRVRLYTSHVLHSVYGSADMHAHIAHTTRTTYI